MTIFFIFTIVGAVIVYFTAKAIDARQEHAEKSGVPNSSLPAKSEDIPAPATEEKASSPTPAAPGFGSAVFLTILAAGIYYLFFYSPGFTDDEIQNAKESIRTEFEKQKNVSVESIDLMRTRDDAGKLIGVVKVKYGELHFAKSCSVTLGEKRSVFWECK